MTRRRWMWPTAYVVSAVVFIAGGAVYVHNHRTTSPKAPTAAALPALTDAAFPVTLDVFPTQHSIPQGHWLVLGVQSAPARTIELWDGPRRFATKPAVVGGNGASFRWPALTVGQHLLYARAVDHRGKTASSQVFSLDVLDPNITVHGRQPVVGVPLAHGETAAGTGRRLGVPPKDVALHGHTALITLPRSPTSSLDGNAVTVASTGRPTTGGPSTGGPSLTVTGTGCAITAHLSGVQGMATLAQAGSGLPGFVSAGTHSGDGDVSLDTQVPGSHLLTVEDAAGRASPVEYTVPQSCAGSAGWTGNLTLIGDVLTLPKPIVHGYVYVGVDNQPFQRIPADPAEFLTSQARRIDLGSQIPELDGHAVRIEAWQQSGLTSTNVATGAFTASPKIPLSAMVGEPDTLGLAALDSNSAPVSTLDLSGGDRKVTFTWAASSTRVNAVRWQVLTEPISQLDTDLSPVGLIATGQSFMAPKPQIVIGKPVTTGTFVIDTHDIATATSGTGIFAVRTTQTVYVRIVPVRSAPPIKGTTSAPQPAIVGPASGAVTLTLPPLPFPAPGAFKIVEADLMPGHVPNFDLADCDDVTVLAGKGSIAEPFPSSGTYCYGDYQHPSGQCDDFFCDLVQGINTIVDGLSDVWDLIAAAFNGLVDLAVAVFAKLNPVCLGIEEANAAIKVTGAPGGGLADQASALCGKIGKVVGRVAISAVLSSFGIPPVLPTSAQLKAIAQGDVTQLGVDLLEELGVPCDSVTLDPDEASAVNDAAGTAGVNVPTEQDGSVNPCALAISAVIKQIGPQLEAQVQQSASNLAGIPYCPPQLCTVVPTPGGRLQPLALFIRAQRTDGVSLGGENADVRVSFLGDSAVPALFAGATGTISTTLDHPDVAEATLTFSTPTTGYSQANSEFQSVADNSSLYTLQPGDAVTATINASDPHVLQPSFSQAFGKYLPKQTR